MIKMGVIGVSNVAYSHLPFLKLPVIRQIFEFVIEKVLSVAINKTDYGLYVGTTTVDVMLQLKDFNKKVEVYEKAKTGNDKYNAERELVDSFRNLAKLRS